MALESRFYRQKGRVTMDENELMGSMKVSKAVAKMAIPSVISSLVTVVYNMADTFFVGQTGDPLQVAAVSQTNPIFILFMAFANMFGMGGSAAASMALGEKKEKRVKQVSSFITYASLIVGIIFAVILLDGMQPVYNCLEQMQILMNWRKDTQHTFLMVHRLLSGLRQQALLCVRTEPAGKL